MHSEPRLRNINISKPISCVLFIYLFTYLFICLYFYLFCFFFFFLIICRYGRVSSTMVARSQTARALVELHERSWRAARALVEAARALVELERGDQELSNKKKFIKIGPLLRKLQAKMSTSLHIASLHSTSSLQVSMSARGVCTSGALQTKKSLSKSDQALCAASRKLQLLCANWFCL